MRIWPGVILCVIALGLFSFPNHNASVSPCTAQTMVSAGGKPDATPAAQCYRHYLNAGPTKRPRWLREAAYLGHAQAQYELAQYQPRQDARLHWLRRSAEQDHPGALMALYEYWRYAAPERARPFLARAAGFSAEARYQLAHLAWQEQDIAGAIEHFNKASEQGHQGAKKMLAIIDRYWQATQPVWSAPIALVTDVGQRCEQRLQFVVSGLDTMTRADALMNALAADKRLSRLPICTLPPLWVSPEGLNCSVVTGHNGRLSCDSNTIAMLPTHPAASHLVIIGERGKANVHNNVVYLDKQDSYSVLVHELAHLAGFVDEYPMSASLAEAVCTPGRAAPNLWVGAAPPAGWVVSRSCEHVRLNAYKPVADFTFMEFHDSEHIPSAYVRWWGEAIRATAK